MPYKEKPFTVKITVEGHCYYVRAKTKREAIEKAAIRKQEILEGRTRSGRDVTVAVWASEWLASYKEGAVNDRYFRDLSGQVNRFVVVPIGNRYVRTVTQADLQAILNGLNGYSDSYRKKARDILKQIFSAAVANGIIDKSPADGLNLPREREKHSRRAITPFEREMTLKTANSARGGLFVLIMLYCGLRPGEVAALEWSDVDLSARVLHVRRALKSDGSIGPPKTPAGVRDVPIPPPLTERLSNEEGCGLVCTNTIGGRYTASSIRQMWRTFKREMNITAGVKVFRNALVPPLAIADDLTLYCYRHTYCTDLERAGVPLNTARRLMGHESVEVTARIYTHATAQAFDDAAAKIDAFFK